MKTKRKSTLKKKLHIINYGERDWRVDLEKSGTMYSKTLKKGKSRAELIKWVAKNKRKYNDN